MKFLERTHRAKKLSKSLIKSQCILLTPLSSEGDTNLKIKGSRLKKRLLKNVLSKNSNLIGNSIKGSCKMTILEKKDLKSFEFNSFLDYNPLVIKWGSRFYTKNSLKNLNTEKNVMSLLGALSKNHLEINKTLTHSVCMILNVLEISKLKYENS